MNENPLIMYVEIVSNMVRILDLQPLAINIIFSDVLVIRDDDPSNMTGKEVPKVVDAMDQIFSS